MDNTLSELKIALKEVDEKQRQLKEKFQLAENSDFFKENKKLHTEIETLKNNLAEAQSKLNLAREDVNLLQRNLRQEVLLRRNAAVYNYSQRLDNKIFTALLKEQNELERITAIINQQAQKTSAELKMINQEESAVLWQQYAKALNDIQLAAEDARNKAQEAANEINKQKSMLVQKLLDDESSLEASALRAARGFFSWDSFFGLKILSALGVLLILFGAYTGGRYIYSGASPALQCASIFGLGLLLLVGGEILNRKWKGIFSLTMAAGGVAVTFLATALGYFTMQVLSMYAAIGICVAVAGIGFFLSNRYKSQTISIFSLIGGYMPIISLINFSGGELTEIWWFSCIYFIILNVFALSFATHQNWTTTRFFGLFSGLVADAFIIATGIKHGSTSMVLIAAAVAYMSYQLIPVLGAAITGRSVSNTDVALLTINTILRFAFGNWIFLAYSLWDYNKILPLFFAASCIALALMTAKGRLKKANSKPLNALFFVTSIAFCALLIPYWLEAEWFSLGWLVQGCGLLIYGIVKDKNKFRVFGWIISSLCLFTFLFRNVFFYMADDTFFVWRYLAITLGFGAIMATYIAKDKLQKVQPLVFFVLCNFACYISYFTHWAYCQSDFKNQSSFYALVTLATVILLMTYSYTLHKIKFLQCAAARGAAITIGISSSLRLWVFNANGESKLLDDLRLGNTAVIIIFMLYLIANILAILWFWDFCKYIVAKKQMKASFYLPMISGYAILLLVQNLYVRTDLALNSIVFTMIFALCALGWTIIGFRQNNIVLRRGGLVLSLFSAAKLFIADLYNLSSSEKIIAYFALGIILLVISFVYQYFEKKQKQKYIDEEELSKKI